MDRSYTDELEKLYASLQSNQKTKDKFIIISSKRHANMELEKLNIINALAPCKTIIDSTNNEFIQQKRQGKRRVY